MHQRGRDAQGVSNSELTPYQREGTEVSHSLEIDCRRPQELAAPDRAIWSIAGPVTGDPEHLAFQPAMLQHSGDDVCVMMLDSEMPSRLQLTPAGRKVFRMQIVNPELRPHVIQG